MKGKPHVRGPNSSEGRLGTGVRECKEQKAAAGVLSPEVQTPSGFTFTSSL